MEKFKETASWLGQGILQVVGLVWEWCRKAFLHFVHQMKTNIKYRRRFMSMMLLPVTVLYYEIVFNLSTERTIFRSRAWLYMVLFSISWGLLLYVFCSISKRRSRNRLITKTLMIFAMLPFGIEYFIYRKFKTLYDLGTINRGAAGALSSFGGTILKMVFSPGGLWHLFLFMLPWALYYWKGSLVDDARRISVRFRSRVLIGMLVFHLLAVLLILFSGTYRPFYNTRYSFTNSVRSFGVLTSFRKEVWRTITGKSKSSSFRKHEDAQSVSPSAAESETEPEVEKPREYGYSQMELDFDALAQKDGGAYAQIDQYVASLTPSRQNEYTGLFEGKNLIFVSAEAFSGWFLDEELTPTLYRMATKGIQFTDFYQPESAGTTGGETANLLGVLAMDGGQSMMDVVDHNNYFTMGSQLDRLGYYGKAYHNNDYTFYDRDKTHNNLGYSDGFLGVGNGMEAYVQPLWPESDLEMVQGSITDYIDRAPFNVYYMSVSGHSDYTFSDNSMANKHQDEVEGLPYSNAIRAYIACNLEFEDAMTYIVEQLEQKGIADDTVIVICADHYPYGLSDMDASGTSHYLEELYGHEVTTTLERDENRLIIWSGCLEKEEPIVVDTPVSSIDILPTLSNLFGTEWDSRLLPGRDVFSDATPLVFNVDYDWKTDLGTYTFATDSFEPATEGTSVPGDYVDKISAIVSNKLEYCGAILYNDYYGHVFGAMGAQAPQGGKGRSAATPTPDLTPTPSPTALEAVSNN